MDHQNVMLIRCLKFLLVALTKITNQPINNPLSLCALLYIAVFNNHSQIQAIGKLHSELKYYMYRFLNFKFIRIFGEHTFEHNY